MCSFVDFEIVAELPPEQAKRRPAALEAVLPPVGLALEMQQAEIAAIRVVVGDTILMAGDGIMADVANGHRAGGSVDQVNFNHGIMASGLR